MHFGSGQYTPYTLQIDEYIKNLGINESDEDVKRVRAALVNIQNKMSQKINQLTSDPTISMCLKGRDMKQIRGNRTRVKKNADGTDVVDEEGKAITESDNQTEGRYPHLLDEKMEKIFAAALNKAEENYGKEYDKMFADATSGADAKVKTALCNSIANKPDLTCKNRNKQGVCTSYAVTSMSSAFNEYDETTGQSKENGVRETFSGTGLKKMLEAQLSNQTAYQQTTKNLGIERGVGRVFVSANYAEDTKTCTLTVETHSCTGGLVNWLTWWNGRKVSLSKGNPDSIRNLNCSGQVGSINKKSFTF